MGARCLSPLENQNTLLNVHVETQREMPLKCMDSEHSKNDMRVMFSPQIPKKKTLQEVFRVDCATLGARTDEPNVFLYNCNC